MQTWNIYFDHPQSIKRHVLTKHSTYDPFLFVNYSPWVRSTIPFFSDNIDPQSLFFNSCLVYDLQFLLFRAITLYTIYNTFLVKYSPCVWSTIPFLLNTRLVYDSQSLFSSITLCTIYNPFFVEQLPCIRSTIPFLLSTHSVYDLQSLFCYVLTLYTIHNPFFVKYSPCVRSTIPFLLNTRLVYDLQSFFC